MSQAPVPEAPVPEAPVPEAPAETPQAPAEAPAEEYSVDDFVHTVKNNDKLKLKKYRKVFKRANAGTRKPKKAVSNKWNDHIKTFRSQNPHLKFKEILQQAKLTYKK
jgi:hypothetical protein